MLVATYLRVRALVRLCIHIYITPLPWTYCAVVYGSKKKKIVTDLGFLHALQRSCRLKIGYSPPDCTAYYWSNTVINLAISRMFSLNPSDLNVSKGR